MSNKPVLFVLGILLCLSGFVHATDIDFISNGVIQNDNSYNLVTLHNSAVVAMTGGTASKIWTYDSSTLQMQSGTVTGWISVYNTSSLLLSGGLVGGLELHGGTASISGGNIAGTLGIFDSTSTVHIYGKELNTIPHNGGGWLITGKWNDSSNSPFSIWYRAPYYAPGPDSPDYPIILHEAPEPATMLLLSFGMILSKLNFQRTLN